jgi:glutamate synthase (NADPH/NADH) small chain
LKSSPRARDLVGKRVIVLGGGNTSIDAVTQTKRLGAEQVTLVYRRGREQMRAYAHEVALAQRDGVRFVYWAQPEALLGENGRVRRLRCRRTAPAGSSRCTTTGETFELEADLVLRATGQGTHAQLLSSINGLRLSSEGHVIVDEQGKTSHPKTWAGGDCANGGKEVVNAVAEGKRAAEDIYRTLRNGVSG